MYDGTASGSNCLRVWSYTFIQRRCARPAHHVGGGRLTADWAPGQDLFPSRLQSLHRDLLLTFKATFLIRYFTILIINRFSPLSIFLSRVSNWYSSLDPSLSFSLIVKKKKKIKKKHEKGLTFPVDRRWIILWNAVMFRHVRRQVCSNLKASYCHHAENSCHCS